MGSGNKASGGSALKKSGNSNKLGLEKSPYLLQHKDNPVWWQPWGEEAFEAARTQNKPIFLSIGYSTCYWCHVMEKDSFEQQDVADLLNRSFISIKVDREERPDVDQLYMEFVQSVTGHGGWPLSVVLTPDLKPFWGGTFFYRSDFLRVLKSLSQAWSIDHGKIVDSSKRLLRIYERENGVAESQPGLHTLLGYLETEESSFDALHGGFGSAPKFPAAQQASLLLRVARLLEDEKRRASARHMAFFTLDKMARGGICDQLAGGFHRYATDGAWLVPHFEKMLYDNALLAQSYLEAYQVKNEPFFARTARRTLDYVLAEMTAPEGGFYSAQDAGEVGREGEFYVWGYDEISACLNAEELELAKRVFNISPAGNFEKGRNILTLAAGVGVETLEDQNFISLRDKLLQKRRERQAPRLDNKIIAGWNGLMISAFARGYQVLRDERYLEAARHAACFLGWNLRGGNGKLLRRYCAGEARFEACADDYAFVIQALLDLYETDFDQRWLATARELLQAQNARFWDEQDGGYFYSHAAEMVAKRKDWFDGALPSGNSVALLNLLRLESLTSDTSCHRMAEKLLAANSRMLEQYPQAFPTFLQGIYFMLAGPKELLILQGKGDDETFEHTVKELHARFIPERVLAAATDQKNGSLRKAMTSRLNYKISNKTALFVCDKRACGLPSEGREQIEQALKRLE